MEANIRENFVKIANWLEMGNRKGAYSINECVQMFKCLEELAKFIEKNPVKTSGQNNVVV